MAVNTDTIVAEATPKGRGGVGIIRLSGGLVPKIAEDILGQLPLPRLATYSKFNDDQGQTLDQGIALYFPSPSSFTGEHVLELQGHGGPVVMDMLLQRALQLGARIARPGEFSERAFLNSRMDLVQAEAVADLIESSTEAAAKSAVRSLQGIFSKKVNEIATSLTELRVYVEAAIDFPEEEIDFLADRRIVERIQRLNSAVSALLQSTQQGCLLREGITIALAGLPNAGKSSLLNILAQRERAIISDIPGTTRDTLEQEIQIDGMPVHVVDTAGLRDTEDQIETEGVRRALAAIEEADRVLLVIDDTLDIKTQLDELLKQIPGKGGFTLIRNKIDLSGRKSGDDQFRGFPVVALSAKTGAGIDALRIHLKDCVGFQNNDLNVFIARRRHLDALKRASINIQTGHQHLSQTGSGELLAEELRLAQNILGEITGLVTSEALLGEIFSSFCIGK